MTEEKVRAEGIYVNLTKQSEEEIMQKIKQEEYKLAYIGTYSVDAGMWSKVLYDPLKRMGENVPRNICEQRYNGIFLEGLCFILNNGIGVWRKEILMKRDNSLLPYLFYDYFEITSNKS
jgi:hypothetical protein